MLDRSEARGRAIVTMCLAAILSLGAAASLAQTTPPSDNLLQPPVDSPIRGMTWPSLSPDGKTLCFTYLGDLWTAPATGGRASRLTVNEALDGYSRWSPDGRWIAFTSTRAGNADAFLIPAAGGDARQVTFDSSNDWVNDWSPDGSKLLFYTIRDTHTWAMWSIDLHTRALKRLSDDDEPLRFGAWSPDGKEIAYCRAGQPWWRPWYRGSVAASVIVEDIATGKVHAPLKSAEQEFWPLWSPDGKYLYFSTIVGDNHTPNLYRVAADGGQPRAVTHYTTDAVRWPSISHDGSLLTYLYDGDLYTMRPDGSDAKRISIYCHSDDKVNNQEIQKLTQDATESELSPDGKQLALVLKGSIWLVKSSGGDAKRLTDAKANDHDILWSPDGKKIVMESDRDNQPDLYILDVATKAVTRLTNDPNTETGPTWSPNGQWITFARDGAEPGLYIISANSGGAERRLADGNGDNNFGVGITSQGWSPDSKWVAFSRMDRLENVDVWVVPAVGGTPINVTKYPGQNVQPRFSKDGRSLLCISTRNGFPSLYQVPLEKEEDMPEDAPDDDKKKPKPDRSKDVKIDFDDIDQRAKQIAANIGPVEDYAVTPNSESAVEQAGGRFWLTELGGGGVRPLTPGPEPGGNIEFVPDGSRFYYTGANGTPRFIAIGGGRPTTGGPAAGGSPVAVVPFTAEMVFDRRAQYQEAFNEFYRNFGRAFYDAKMHGVNWRAEHDKYEPLLEGVATPEEFANLLSEMVGEVNSSHSEVGPASKGGGPQTATLGLDYDDSYTGPGLKVKAVMSKGPADKPQSRINPGDYVLSIDGTDVRCNEDYYLPLQDMAGKTVDVVVNTKPSKDGAHTLKIKPVTEQQWLDLEYDARVRHNRELVDRLSQGKLAYIHVRGMDQPSLKKFERELWSIAADKEGLVLDIRGNGGGNTHDAILEALSRRVYGYTQPRDGLRESQPVRAWTKPIVLLIDQNSYSDAEIFPAGFRALHLGKIVGVSTPGYVIGTYGGRLVDGTTYRLPTWGWFTADGKNMENLGIPPDINVENRPEDIVAHRDRQLEVAVTTAVREIPSHADLTASAK